MKSQKGIAHLFLILIILAGIGLGIFFIKNPTFFMPRADQGSLTTQTTKEVKVLQLTFLPVDSGGVNIDRSIVGPGYFASTLEQARTLTTKWDQENVQILTDATKFRGYKNPSAIPAIQYKMIDKKEYLTPAPLSSNKVPWNAHIPTYRFDFMKILGDVNVCDYVDNKGVRQVWYTAYHFGPAEPYESNMAMGRKSKAYWNFGTYGNISNSERINDMPVCENTYVLLGVGDPNGTLHDLGHQIENTLDWVDTNLFRKLDYPFGETAPTVNRCGTVHEPPNTKKAYQYNSEENRKSDCEDWKPDGGGEVKDINCHTWYGQTCSGHEGQDKEYLSWWMQNIPGLNNGLTSGGQNLRSWWDFIADFDTAVAVGKTLTQPATGILKTGFSLKPVEQSVSPGGEFKINVEASSDFDAANLFTAIINYPADKVRVVSISPRLDEDILPSFFIKKWIEQTDDQKGTITLSGAVPNPGVKTGSGNPGVMATITFKTTAASGEFDISVNSQSAIYRNSDNQNIISSNSNAKIKVGAVLPSPSSSATPIVDTDSDGFSDSDELFYGTDPKKGCGLNAWPPDLNNDTGVNGTDISLMVPYIDGTNPYNKRYDFNKDGKIDQAGDIPIIQKFMLKTCTLPLPSPSIISSPSVSPTPVSSPSPSPSKRVFVTSQRYAGNLGGVSGADSKCQSSADSAKLGGSWKAWISDSTISASSRLEHSSAPYKLVNGLTIANNWNDLTDSLIQNSINLTEKNQFFFPSGFAVWTGTDSKGNPSPTNCANWTLSSSQQLGGIGSTGSISSSWTASGSAGCDGATPLFCFEQSTPSSTPIDPKRADLYKDSNKPNFVNDQDISVFFTKCAEKGIELFGQPASVQPICDINNDGTINSPDWSILIKYRNQQV